MKKATVDQLDLLLSALRDRLENPEDFLRLEADFEGGTRAHAAVVTLADAGSGDAGTPPAYRFVFPGGTTTGDAGHVLARLHELAVQYDAAEIRLVERGGGRRLSAGPRGVSATTLPGAPAAKPSAPGAPAVASPGTEPHEDESLSWAGTSTDYRVTAAEAGPLLRELGFLDPNGRLRNDKLRKYNQTDRFVDRLDPVLRDLCAKHERVRVLDCACGKSYLSFVLNWYIREKLGHPCSFLGLDLSEGVVAASQARAQRLGYRNMAFRTEDLRTYEPVAGEAPHLVISLHACDVATDLAMAAGVHARADAIACVPCCQKELLSQDFRMPGLEDGRVSQGVLRARMADLLTDAMRVLLLSSVGYATTIVEYVSPLDTPKNLLVTSLRTGRPDAAAAAEYRRLSAQVGAGITLGRLIGGKVSP
jgi:SAM-dependent methyltransferase